MKIRIDFVSNSSSCSFVVAISNEAQYKLNDFIKDIVKDCATCKDTDYRIDKEEIKKLNVFNTRNLEYHLNSSELLFLGTLKLCDKTYTVTRPNPKNYSTDNIIDEYKYKLGSFERLQKDIKKESFGKETGEKVIEANDDHIVISYPVYASGIAFPSMNMTSFTCHYHWIDPSQEKKEDRKHAAKRIMQLMNMIKGYDYGDLYYFINTHTYFISKETIWNTRALLENNAELIFEKWEDLDALEKRLNEGQRLFVIRQNNGGDGWDNDAIYALGGWDSKFADKATAEILWSEIM